LLGSFKTGHSANLITLFVLLATRGWFLIAWAVARRWFGGGVHAPRDAVDGAAGTLQSGRGRQVWGFLDSVVDRYDEMILLAGVLYYFQTTSFYTGRHVLKRALRFGTRFVHACRAEGSVSQEKAGIFSRIESAVVLLLVVFNQIFISVGYNCVWQL
jgi:hypothetical protein